MPKHGLMSRIRIPVQREEESPAGGAYTLGGAGCWRALEAWSGACFAEVFGQARLQRQRPAMQVQRGRARNH